MSAGFIGLGQMGTPMASNLFDSGVQLYLYNRTKEKARPLTDKGAHLVDSPKELFAKTNIVFSMVANDEALKSLTLGKNGLLESAKANAIHVSMSTVSPQLVKELTRAHQEKGVSFISAPVFGRPDVATKHNLWICVAGEEKAKAAVLPLLRKMGQKV